MSETREGAYHEWEWNPHRKCWEAFVPLRIYPHEDGTFTVATHDVWREGLFDTFEAAEFEAVS